MMTVTVVASAYDGDRRLERARARRLDRGNVVADTAPPYNVGMPLSVVNGHPAHEDTPDGGPEVVRAREVGVLAQDVAAPASTDLKVRLSQVDRVALDGLVDPRNVPDLVATVEASATSLAGADRRGAHLRLVARIVATQRARMLTLEGILDQFVVAGDFYKASAVDKLLTSTEQRLCRFLAAHLAACNAGRRATVLVGHADQVHVEANR